MIATIFRPKQIKNGKIKTARLYRGRYRFKGETKITDIPLHTSSKRVARKLLEEIIQEKELERAGMIPPGPARAAAKIPLEQHLKVYIADLRVLRRDHRYICELEKRIKKLMRECKWTVLAEITADSFQAWRARQRIAPKTLNEYLASGSSFLNWMKRHNRIACNPLETIQKIQTNGTQIRPRRALTDGEMHRLLAVSGSRRVIYLTAVYTGLRRSELMSLERTDLHLEAEKPFITVPASATKNHKQVVLALHPDLIPELSQRLEKLPSLEQKIFADLMPTMDLFRADLKAAQIDFIDARGRRVDFHSLRHTLATNLARSGVAPRIAMEIMRHSDMRLTMITYMDTELLPTTDAIVSLPSFST